jgi:cysteine synthase A
LTAVHGVEAAAALEGIERVRVYREPGYEIRPFRLGSDRIGAVLALGSSREQAVERAERAANLVRFETVDVDAQPRV